MQVTVRYFASVREAVGRDTEAWQTRATIAGPLTLPAPGQPLIWLLGAALLTALWAGGNPALRLRGQGRAGLLSYVGLALLLLMAMAGAVTALGHAEIEQQRQRRRRIDCRWQYSCLRHDARSRTGRRCWRGMCP